MGTRCFASGVEKMNNEKLPKYYTKINGETWLVENERNNMKLYYKVQEILSSRQSPLQQVDIIKTYDFGRCLVLDGVIQTTELDGYIYNEMITHIPAVTHPNPKRILIIGGGDCGAANELTKYPEIERMELVEIDETVVRECLNKLPQISGKAANDSRINFIFKDGVSFVQDKKEIYDLAIVDSSDPVGPAEVLFSEGFYINLKNSLKKDGLMVCQSQSPVFHREILKKTRNILKKHFPIVRTYKTVVPSYPGGMWSFTLASLKYDPMDADTVRLAGNTRYINNEIFYSAFILPNFIRDI